MQIVFISGGMTGYTDWNHPAFDKKAFELRNQGYTVFNPASLPLGLEYQKYMEICLPMIEACDIVYFLYGWQYSKGARMEFDKAIECGKQLMFEEPIDHTQFIRTQGDV